MKIPRKDVDVLLGKLVEAKMPLAEFLKFQKELLTPKTVPTYFRPGLSAGIYANYKFLTKTRKQQPGVALDGATGIWYAWEHDWEFEWKDDRDFDWGELSEQDRKETSSVVECLVWRVPGVKRRGNLLASLGGITEGYDAKANRDYRFEIESELAYEAMLEELKR